MKFLSALIIALMLSQSMTAQEQDSLRLYPNKENVYETGSDGEISYSLSTPYNTVYTHLKFLQPESYYPAISAKTFKVQDEDLAKELAVKLKQILDGKGLYVDMEIIPNKVNHVDSSTGLKRYVLFKEFPEIYVEKSNDNWYYSNRTASAIPDLHSKVYPLGSDFLINLMPKVGRKEVLGLQVWQYLGILILILITVILHKIFTVIIEYGIQKIAKRVNVAIEQLEMVAKVAKPISWMLLTLLLVLFIPAIQLPIKSAKYVVIILNALTPFFAMLAGYRAVDLISIYLVRQAARTESTLDDQLIPLVRKSLKIFIVVAGILFILNNLNFNITTLLAGISIGGLAFALAAQDTIKNLFGSLMIFVDRPFQIGDWINFAGVDGMVEEVGFRSTRVRTFANSLVSVPNGKIADMVVDNFGLRVYRRFKTTISVTYDTPPDLIEKFVEGLNEIVSHHPQTRKDYYEIHMNEMGAASLNIMFYAFFHVPSWSDELKARHEVILAILRLAEELGVRFAFPTQTIHIEEFPEKKALSPEYDTDSENMNKKIAAFIANYKGRVS